MSRLDKRHYQDNIIGSEDDQLRAHLYAFSNTRPTYKVVFSPASPIIIFKTKLNNEEQSALTSGTAYNPCKAWNSLAELLFTHHPNRIHAMYLLDLASWMHQTTEPLEEAEAQLRASSLGEVLRQTSNVVAKLNPANAHLLAAAASCLLALKFVLVGEKIHGHGDHRYVQQLLLVSPSSVALLRELTESAKGLRRTPEELAYPKPRVCVLVSEGSDPSELQEWLQSCDGSLFESTEVCFYNNTNPDTSLFHRLAVLTGHPIPSPEGSELDSHTRYATKRVYQIDFVLSKQTKTVEQIATRYPLEDEDDSNDENEEEEEEGEVHEDNCGCGDHHHHENHNHNEEEDDDNNNNEEEDAVPPTIITGISSLLHIKDTVQVLIEGRVLDPANHLVATTEGCVHAAGLGDLLDGGKYTRDATVTFSATVARDATGKTFLEVSEARFMTKKEVKQSYTVGESLQELPLSYLFSSYVLPYRCRARPGSQVRPHS
ncbi:hypothetical protein ADEAN_000357300 [Angomonas deanei]|uniref:Uncharacterized protein n=1 Tax=Angomonas deanei TaxID=59799 RepID=A0A7G2CDA2_9TRYP|nr:hypothetical protein ADEAN_000357300 [Angomonas deanei]